MNIPPLVIPEDDALALSAQWVADVATGSVAGGMATIAVAGIGFAMLAGRINVRRSVGVVVGCFIVFGAPTIAGALSKLAGAGRVPVEQTALYAPPSIPPPPQAQPNDPYAGASLIR